MTCRSLKRGEPPRRPRLAGHFHQSAAAAQSTLPKPSKNATESTATDGFLTEKQMRSSFCRMKGQNLQKTGVNKEKSFKNEGFSGADSQIRTGDLILTKDALYLLSYISTLPQATTILLYTAFYDLARGIFKKQNFFRNAFPKQLQQRH